MKKLRSLLSLPVILTFLGASVSASEIRDSAGMFGADAVKEARSRLQRVEKEFGVPLWIESVDTTGGVPIPELAVSHAKRAGTQGVFVLLAKKEHKIQVEVSRGFQKAIPESARGRILEAFLGEFKKNRFDDGLLAGISSMESVLSKASQEAGGKLTPAVQPPSPARRVQPPARAPAFPPARAGQASGFGFGSVIGLILIILAVVLVFRLIAGAFSGGRGYGAGMGPAQMGGPGPGGFPPGPSPGYGHGYGGGGGGFFSSLFGGIGGAMAGNWLYDQFSGRNRHHDYHGGDYASGTPVTDASQPQETWGSGGTTGDWGGGGGDSGGSSGGGDWGGGGGGDWGGGGGGDWGGGGGGGDWGGGGDSSGGW